MKKVLLVCAQGMSTGMLVNKMRETARKDSYDCVIEACAVSQAKSKGLNADVVLIGPQVKYELEKIREMFPDKPVEIINIVDYGRLNGEKVLNTVKKLIGG